MLVMRTPYNRKTLENQTKSGRLRRLSSGIYSSDLSTDPATQIRQHLVKVLSYLRPGAVISHRSALRTDFGAGEGVVIVTDPAVSHNYVHPLPGLRVLATPGPGPMPGDANLGGGPAERIHVSSPFRAALENREPRRIVKSLGIAKQADPEETAAFLEAQCANAQRAEGLRVGIEMLRGTPGWHWDAERESLLRFLQAQEERRARTPVYLSPRIDHARVALFEQLAQHLRRGVFGNETLRGAALPDFPSRPDLKDPRFLNLAFYESYFSNYIEGTEFAPEAAHEIALDERREDEHELARDGHDIRALYRLYADPEEFLRVDRSPAEFLANLRHWHARFGAHQDKAAIHPGQFKDRPNRAGATWFTDPAQVEGTLSSSWEIGQTLEEPFDRAVFRAVSTVSVHPFLDGNGRITRLAASNLLGRAGKIRMMIPTVFREDYLLALRAFSNGDPVPVIRMFARAVRITRSVPFDRPFPALTAWLKERRAFDLPKEARWQDAEDEPADEGSAPGF